jgi:fatty-acyl-CoA synthase
VIDEDGYCSIVGRLKDMIIRGGENIYPREVEEALFRHEAIAEVQVFGIPDEKFGEIACAWVRLADNATLDETALRAWCRTRLAHYKIPAHFAFVESLPLTASGKPQKFIMRDEMIRMLAEQSGRQTA